MTMLFHPNIANMFLFIGVVNGLNYSPGSGTTGVLAITVYSGAKPTAAAIEAGFASYNSTNAAFLAHYTGAVFTQTSGGLLATLTTIPAAVNASNTGTGAWAIIWSTNPALASMGGALPTNSFMVVDVSDNIGNGVVRFSDTSFSAGVSKAILDASFGAVSP